MIKLVIKINADGIEIIYSYFTYWILAISISWKLFFRIVKSL